MIDSFPVIPLLVKRCFQPFWPPLFKNTVQTSDSNHLFLSPSRNKPFLETQSSDPFLFLCFGLLVLCLCCVTHAAEITTTLGGLGRDLGVATLVSALWPPGVWPEGTDKSQSRQISTLWPQCATTGEELRVEGVGMGSNATYDVGYFCMLIVLIVNRLFIANGA